MRASATIRIDRTPPLVSCTAVPSVLSPPDNERHPVKLAAGVEDALSGPLEWRLIAVTSNGEGDGDVQGFDVGTADADGFLRAVPSYPPNPIYPPDPVRVYILTLEGTDVAGNAAQCQTQVTVATPVVSQSDWDRRPCDD